MKTEYKKYHFIGIGGIGMSALARLLHSRGAEISGSDSNRSDITDALEEEKMDIYVDQKAENLNKDVKCVIYTLAIGDDNPEFLKAKELGLPIFTYAEYLGKVSSDMKTIAIAGTHGKTTTTAMINEVLWSAGEKPHTIVGSLLCENKTNYVEGDSNLFVVEACEYKKSFLNLNPDILVITNIEEDHLDFYKDLDDIKDAFMELADKTTIKNPNRVGHNGYIICDFDDPNVDKILKKHKDKVINWRDFISNVPELRVIGQHNILNSAAALAVVNTLDLDIDKAKIGLMNFRGTWRRLEYNGETENGAIIYDDYAHHPTEIKSSLSAIREKYPDKKLCVFFQPHLYSRTKILFDDFVEIFKEVDELYLLPIYAARELNDPKISSEILANAIAGAKALNNFDEAAEEIKKKDSNYVVVTVGAGDINQIIDKI